ncbi:Pr6Pr family membrane protein [Nitratireductor basaltis]|uniref:FAR-17a/AIG1-like protein n=1 Tax=Nitratireductor basaltis TaxID=472175 RepID=A0A084UBF8_9HYPH|nr:Pr6Pr family membrane protein [Nitratireductor basaltis]KFB10294.1 hypothetical protein EL18_01325 [Nitratireductor basaltis]
MVRLVNIAGAVIGIAALVLQFSITVPASMEAGRSLPGSVVYFFSFFTILTNILAVLVHLNALTGRPEAFARSTWRGGIAVAIAVVFLVYHILLADLWKPEGLFYVCDVALHYVTPALFVLWWMMTADGSLGWRHLFWWLVWPVGYAVYALARAPIAGEVPYPFLDAAVIGFPRVLLAIAAIALLFIAVGVVFLAYDYLVGRRRSRAVVNA